MPAIELSTRNKFRAVANMPTQAAMATGCRRTRFSGSASAATALLGFNIATNLWTH